MKALSLLTLYTLAVALTLPATAEEKEKPGLAIGATAPDFSLTDIHGKSWTVSDAVKSHGAKTVVIEFLSSKCPVSLKYDDKVAPAYAQLLEKDVLYLGVCSSHDGHETAKDLRKWAAEKRIAFPVLVDSESKVADLFGAQKTPEFFVLDGDMAVRYHGAMDNDKPVDDAARVDYITAAVDAVQAGKEVAKKEVASFGCGIKRKA